MGEEGKAELMELLSYSTILSYGAGIHQDPPNFEGSRAEFSTELPNREQQKL